MNLNNFEKDFDKKILKRGMEYYNNKYVCSIEKISDSEYTAEIEGSEIYTVDVRIEKDGEISLIECDCPYEYGDYCKHEAAVLYALRDKKIKVKSSKIQLDRIIAECNKNQLAEAVLEYARKDKDFREYLEIKLSGNSDNDKIIDDFRKITERFSKGRSSIKSTITSFQGIFRKISAVNNLVERMRLYHDVIDIFYDSSEDFYEYDEEVWEIYEAMEKYSEDIEISAEKLISEKNQSETEKAWNYLTDCWRSESDYDYIFPVLMKFAKLPEYRKKLDSLLENKENSAPLYKKIQIVSERFELLKTYGTPEEQKKFIYDHISIAGFRMKAVDIAIAEKDYENAEKLARNGLESSGDDIYSLRIYSDGNIYNYEKAKWLEKLHDIYTISGNKKKLVEICYTLIISGFENYYKEWKSLIPENKRQAEIKKLVNDKNNKSYLFVIVEEKITELIYKACADKKLNICDNYFLLLNTEYSEKGRNLFEKTIYSMAENTSDRKQYKEICRCLKIYKKQFGKAETVKIVDYFRKNYNRRRAFMEELSKAGF